MLEKKIKSIFEQFKHEGEFTSYQELVSGHINDTYLIKTKEKPYFVLQRINHGVFKNVPGLITNKVSVSLHIRKKMAHLSEKELKRRVLSFLNTNDDAFYHKDSDGNYWNMMIYIDNSITFETVNNEEVAYEAGKIFSEFLNLTSDFDVSKLVEVIPKFHDMSFRYSQFKSALQSTSKERLYKSKLYIDYVTDLKEEMHILQDLKESGKIKLRLTHNDTKISNALFTKENKGLCVIDTDTIMLGIIHYDYGDAIRTICNTSSEDEKNLDLVEFNATFYRAYTKGFLNHMKSSLTPLELECLPLAAKTMIFIMALRFLTDYLNFDVYYKTNYTDHNLDRAKNQFKLLESLTKQLE